MKILATGQFAKTLPVWDGSEWDAGWVDNRGRFRVYRPDYPRAYSGGYALRAHVVWWLKYGEVHPDGFDLHHKDRVRTNDRLENLELVEHRQHSRLTNQGPDRQFTCHVCGHVFWVNRKHLARERKYCSHECYSKAPRTESHRKAIADGLKRAYATGVR